MTFPEIQHGKEQFHFSIGMNMENSDELKHGSQIDKTLP